MGRYDYIPVAEPLVVSIRPEPDYFFRITHLPFSRQAVA